MNIEEVEIKKIKPDPDQPRTSIDEIDLREMAQSIVTEGIINPIEVDNDLMIITGERRWRAAMIAGLKTVPVKILKLDKDQRFMRQVIENIHHNTMSDWDTANALQKLIDISFSPSEKHQTPLTGPTSEKGISWLVEKTGKSYGYISEKLSILKQNPKIQKAIKEGDIQGGFVRAINATPEKYRPVIEKKILDGEFSTRDNAVRFAHAVSREADNPKALKKLLDIDYSKHKGAGEVINVISNISPPFNERIIRSYEPAQDLSKIVDDLKDWINTNHKKGVGIVHAPRVLINMNFAKHLIDAWLAGKEDKLLNK
jgi:ParB family transcriptional regulator, chromosome partitioning protein